MPRIFFFYYIQLYVFLIFLYMCLKQFLQKKEIETGLE
jgi:hypothetical protein